MLGIMADPEFTSYDRDVLYEQVWAEPVRDLAKRYGVSDVALAKACRRLSVPLPGRGYWAKRRAGMAPPRPALPAAAGPTRVPVSGAPPGTWAREVKKTPVSKVRVAEELRRPQELVAAARAALREERFLSRLASCAWKGASTSASPRSSASAPCASWTPSSSTWRPPAGRRGVAEAGRPATAATSSDVVLIDRAAHVACRSSADVTLTRRPATAQHA
jgi:hypothetical protein